VDPNSSRLRSKARARASVADAIKSPDAAQRFSAEGATPVATRLERFSAHLRSGIATWRKRVRDAGLKLH